MTSEAPERVKLGPAYNAFGDKNWKAPEADRDGVEYVRADLLDALQARVAELEHALAKEKKLTERMDDHWVRNVEGIERKAWNDAIRAAADICDQERHNMSALTSNPPQSAAAFAARNRIRTLLRNKGDSDD